MGLLRNLQLSYAYSLFPSQFVAWIDAVSDFIDNSPGSLPNGGSFATAAVGTPGSGRVIDITAAQLALLTTGEEIWVQSFRQTFVWQPTSTKPVDQITVLNPTVNTANPGRFIRENIASRVWYNDAANFTMFTSIAGGNDEYDGSSAVFVSGLVGPVATHAELNRRLGPAVITPMTSLTIMQVGDNVAEQATYVIKCLPGGNFFLQGQLPASSFTGAITAHTDLAVTANPATTDFADITSTWTPATEVGRLLLNVTKNTYSWVDADLTGGKARVSPGCQPNLLVPGVVTPTVNSANGDTIATFVPPKMSPRLTNLNPTFTGGGVDGFVCVQFFEIMKLVSGTNIILPDQACIQNCNISTSLTDALAAGTTFQNCEYTVPGGSTPIGDLGLAEVIWMAGRIKSGAVTLSRKSFWQFQNDTLINTTAFTISNNAMLSLIGAGWCNTATPITLSNLGQLRCLTPSANGGGAWCSSKAANANTGVGVATRRMTQTTLDTGTVPTLTGASGDFTVSGSGTARAFDPVAAIYNATPRACTWALLTTSFAGGGFGSALFDPVSCAYLGVNA